MRGACFCFFDRLRLHLRLRVRWVEVGIQTISFNGHYLMYFATAVAADLVVRKATVDQPLSACTDEQCEVGIRCESICNSSMLLQAALFRGKRLLLHGELVYVFADPATQTAKQLPPDLRAVPGAFEAGEPMVDAYFGPCRRLMRACAGQHRLDLPLATGRLPAHAPGVSGIGWMPVLAPQRGSGVGSAVLDEASIPHQAINCTLWCAVVREKSHRIGGCPITIRIRR